MRADLEHSELDISLSPEEILTLSQEPLVGKINLRNRLGEPVNSRDLEIKIERELGEQKMSVDALPPQADFNQITRYEVALSFCAYQELLQRGQTTERFDGPVDRVNFYRE